MTKSQKKVLFVCLGNICRSPTAEAVFRHLSEQAGLSIDIDSAGTIGYHKGKAPDARAMAAGEARGYSFESIQSRPVTASDFDAYDYIFAMDRHNLADLEAMCPPHHHHKIELFLSLGTLERSEVPDPYYGGDDGFELVLDLIEDASHQLIQKLSS